MAMVGLPSLRDLGPPYTLPATLDTPYQRHSTMRPCAQACFPDTSSSVRPLRRRIDPSESIMPAPSQSFRVTAEQAQRTLSSLLREWMPGKAWSEVQRL